MALTELERSAAQELAEDLRQRIELEQGGLQGTQFKLAKLQIRVKLFGKTDLDDEERERFAQVYPDAIARHEAEIAHLQAQLDKLLAYAET
jgi:hypothetical protein